MADYRDNDRYRGQSYPRLRSLSAQRELDAKKQAAGRYSEPEGQPEARSSSRGAGAATGRTRSASSDTGKTHRAGTESRQARDAGTRRQASPASTRSAATKHKTERTRANAAKKAQEARYEQIRKEAYERSMREYEEKRAREREERRIREMANAKPSRNKKQGRRSSRSRTIHTGVIFVLIVIVLFAIQVFHLIAKKPLSIYEVQAISLAKNDQAKAILLREEISVTATDSGYVSRYSRNGTRVRKGEQVYGLDGNSALKDLLEQGEVKIQLNDIDISDLKDCISEFTSLYDNKNFYEIAELKERLDSELKTISDAYILEHINTITTSSGVSSSLTLYRSPSAGMVSYFSDSLDGITVQDVSKEIFDMLARDQKQSDVTKREYQEYNLYQDEAVNEGEVVYKLLTNENWQMMIMLTEEQYEKISDYTRLKFCINKDRLWVNRPVTFMKIQDTYFARIEMNQYLYRYMDERFLDISLDLNAEGGLKVPNTAITEKEFYLIPKAFIEKGGNENKQRGIVQPYYNEKSGEMEYKFLEAEIYYEDDEYCYIDKEIVAHGTFIYDPESKTDFQVSLVAPLQGVYNLNKGYAVFRRVDVLYRNEDYSIVRSGLSDSLAEFDHIASDAGQIGEFENVLQVK